MVHDVFHGVFTICREEEQHSIGLWAGADTTCDSFSRHEWCEGGETSSVTYRTCFMVITLYYHQDGGTPPLWTSRALRSFIACSITLNKPSWNMIRRGCCVWAVFNACNCDVCIVVVLVVFVWHEAKMEFPKGESTLNWHCSTNRLIWLHVQYQLSYLGVTYQKLLTLPYYYYPTLKIMCGWVWCGSLKLAWWCRH